MSDDTKRLEWLMRKVSVDDISYFEGDGIWIPYSATVERHCELFRKKIDKAMKKEAASIASAGESLTSPAQEGKT